MLVYVSKLKLLIAFFVVLVGSSSSRDNKVLNFGTIFHQHIMDSLERYTILYVCNINKLFTRLQQAKWQKRCLEREYVVMDYISGSVIHDSYHNSHANNSV